MIGMFFKSVFLLFTWSLSAIAAEPYGPTEQEAKMLPAYCQGDEYWKSVLGPDIGWNNHTCYGINRLNRYYKSTNSRVGKAQLETALDDFNYSIGHLKPDFKLMPEIYLYRGTTYKLLARNGEAAADFLKAISLDPKLARAYSELADVYASRMSRRDKALEIVTEGLRHNPQVKGLQRLYREFGGKLPYPEAAAEKTIAAEESKPVIKPETGPAVAPASEAATGQAADSAGSAAPAGTAPQVTPAKIGSPKNPYCRFCPD
jgi:tetratricopeptide (TPR) repeat protein